MTHNFTPRLRSSPSLAKLNKPSTFDDSKDAAPALPHGKGVFPSLVYVRKNPEPEDSNLWRNPRFAHSYIFCYGCYLNYRCHNHYRSSHTYHFSEYVVKCLPQLPLDVQRIIAEYIICGSPLMSRWAIRDLRRVNRSWRKLVDSTASFRQLVVVPRFMRLLERVNWKLERIKPMDAYYAVCAEIRTLFPNFYFNDKLSRMFRPHINMFGYPVHEPNLTHGVIEKSTADLRSALQKCKDRAQWVVDDEIEEETIIHKDETTMKTRRIIIETRRLHFSESDLHGDYESCRGDYYNSDSD